MIKNHGLRDARRSSASDVVLAVRTPLRIFVNLFLAMRTGNARFVLIRGIVKVFIFPVRIIGAQLFFIRGR